jgi:hypothetical protein
MRNTIGIYTSSTTTSTTTTLPGPDVELQSKFAWVAVSAPAQPELEISEELAAEIQEALAAADRGETLDLGSFAQYVDDDGDDG